MRGSRHDKLILFKSFNQVFSLGVCSAVKRAAIQILGDLTISQEMPFLFGDYGGSTGQIRASVKYLKCPDGIDLSCM